MKKKKNSLEYIIKYHESYKNIKLDKKNIKIGTYIGSGSYNATFTITGDKSKVFRILKPSKSEQKYYNDELYGLILQYYFSQEDKCINHVCKVHDFGTITYDGKELVYAILQAADFDMKKLKDVPKRKILAGDNSPYYNNVLKPIYDIYTSLTLDSFKTFCKELYDAIKCIHKHGFVHSDIKPANVGIVINKNDKTITPILFDFGLAAKKDEPCPEGTNGYAPYNHNDNNKCLQEKDLYAYGIMLLSMLFNFDVHLYEKKQHNNQFSEIYIKDKKKDELKQQLTKYDPSDFYIRLCKEKNVDIDDEKKNCMLLISSLLYSVEQPHDNASKIDVSWLGTTQDESDIKSDVSSVSKDSISNDNLSEIIADGIESGLSDNSDSKSVDTTDLGNIVSKSIVSAFNPQAQGSLGSESSESESSSSTASSGSVPLVSVSSSASTSVSSTASGSGSGSEEFTSGFLLVCPSSMKVVSIFNNNDVENIIAYDNNMSDNKYPSFNPGSIDEFIKQIDTFIKTPNICNNKDILTTLFTYGFMNAIQGNNKQSIMSDPLTTLFTYGFMNAIQGLPTQQGNFGNRVINNINKLFNHS